MSVFFQVGDKKFTADHFDSCDRCKAKSAVNVVSVMASYGQTFRQLESMPEELTVDEDSGDCLCDGCQNEAGAIA